MRLLSRGSLRFDNGLTNAWGKRGEIFAGLVTEVFSSDTFQHWSRSQINQVSKRV
ncbi:MAG TPA: hypothetical protein VMJ32_01130 [Pirellulales bacterium]|nr:hypothetical protein [Pirellulales bacterium]